MRRIGQWLPKALFESALIVLSILAALAVDQWRDNRARAERATEARASFVHEIKSNRELIRSAPILPHHKRLEGEYRELAAAESSEPGSVFQTGMHPAALRDAAWRSFSNSATLVDFAPAEVVLLSDIYRAQEALERLNYGFIGAIQAPRSDRETPEFKKDMTRSTSMFLNDVVPLEERLLQLYEDALGQIEARSDSAAAR